MVDSQTLKQQRDNALIKFRSINNNDPANEQAYRQAKTAYIVANEEYLKSVGRETSKERQRRLQVKRTPKIFQVSADLDMFGNQRTYSGQTNITTFTNRIGSQVKVKGNKTRGQLTPQQQKTLNRGNTTFIQRLDNQRNIQQPTFTTNKRNISQVLPGVREISSSQGFTQQELKMIQQSSNPTQAVKAIKELQQRQQSAEKQKLQTFLKASITTPSTQRQVDVLNKAIDTEIKRLTTKIKSKDKLKSSISKLTSSIKDIITNPATASGYAKFQSSPIQQAKFMGKVGVEIGKIVYNIIRIPDRALLGTVNYGRNLVKRGFWSKTNNPLANDIKKLSTGTLKVTSFVVNNPAETGMIIGIAVASGLTIAATTIKNKPEKALAEAIVFLTPLKIPRGITTPLKSSKVNIYKITSTVKPNLKTGQSNSISKIKGTLSGKTITGNNIEVRYSLKIENNKVTGNVYQYSKGKLVSSKKLNYIDEGSFYRDISTGNKISKDVLPISSQKIKVSSTKQTPTEQSILAVGKGTLVKQNVDIERNILTIINGVQKTNQRTTSLRTVRFQSNNSKQKKFKALANQLSKIVKTKRTTKFKPLTRNELDFIEDYLKNFVRYDKDIYLGIDRRTRLAKVLGVTKSSPRFNTIESIIDNNGKVKSVILRDIEVKSKGIKIYKKPKKTIIKRGSIRKNKQGLLNINSSKNQYDFREGNNLRQKVFNIPDLKFSSILTLKQINLIKRLNVYKRVLLVLDKLKGFEQGKFRYTIKQLNKLENVISKDIIKLNEITKTQLKKIDRIQEPTRTQTFKNTRLNKIKQNLTQKVNKVNRVNTKSIKPPVKPLRVPRIRLDIDNNLKRGENPAYNIQYREKGKVKTLNTKLPINKALKRISDIVDNTTARSMQLVRAGITKKKDVTSVNRVLNKFRVRKTKKALLLVEKSKHLIDTPGEKRGLSIAKYIKKKKPTIKRKRKK